MDALMAALVLSALCQLGDKTPWLAAILADRFRAPGLVIVAAGVGLGVNYALGVLAGTLLAPLMTPEARTLLLALALVLAGVSSPFRQRKIDRLETWHLGAFATSALGLAIMAFGDRMQFVAAALATRTPLPWLAAVGATLGALAVVVPATLIGEARWTALPLAGVRVGVAAVLVVAGLWIGLGAIGLV